MADVWLNLREHHSLPKRETLYWLALILVTNQINVHNSRKRMMSKETTVPTPTHLILYVDQLWCQVIPWLTDHTKKPRPNVNHKIDKSEQWWIWTPYRACNQTGIDRQTLLKLKASLLSSYPWSWLQSGQVVGWRSIQSTFRGFRKLEEGKKSISFGLSLLIVSVYQVMYPLVWIANAVPYWISNTARPVTGGAFVHLPVLKPRKVCWRRANFPLSHACNDLQEHGKLPVLCKVVYKYSHRNNSTHLSIVSARLTDSFAWDITSFHKWVVSISCISSFPLSIMSWTRQWDDRSTPIASSNC